MTHEELTEIVDPLRELSPLELHHRLHDLHLPEHLERRVRAELQKRRQVEIVDRAFADGGLMASGSSIDEVVDAIFGLAPVTK